MARSTWILTAMLASLACAASAFASARVRSLPPVDRVVTAPVAASRCVAGPLRPANAVDVPWRSVAPAALLVRSLGRRQRGDWDLLVLDRDGRSLDAARGSSGREAVQAVLPAGSAVTVRACRMPSAPARLRLRFESVALLGNPEPAGRSSLVEVTAGRDGVRKLASLGLDLGEDGHGGDVSVVIHGDRDRALLEHAGLPYRTVVADLAEQDRRDRAAELAASTRASDLPSGRTTYRTYEEIQAELKSLAAAHPGAARAFALPERTSQGREISGIEVADDVELAARDGRPTLFVVGVHHAREWPSAEIAMEHAYDLLSTRSDTATRDLLRTVRVVVVPVQNPDGFVWSRGNTAGDLDPDGGTSSLLFGFLTDTQAYRRRTCAGPLPPAAPCDLQPGVDSNRNYGANWGGRGASTLPTDQTYRGEAPWSAPETEAIHRLLQRTNASVIISLHTVLGAVLRPPGVRADGAPPDDDAMRDLADAMAEVTGYNSTTFHEGLGYDGSGITEDWGYGALGSFTLSFELGGPGFHSSYPVGVIEQWRGPDAAGGMRSALRIAARAAADASTHAILDVRSQPGATLRLSKTFTTLTDEVCTVNTFDAASCAFPAPPIELPDAVRFEATVPSSGTLLWHVPPSTRPFVRRGGGIETYTLTCERGGKVLEERAVAVERGKRVTVPCAAPAANKGKAKAKPKAKKKKKKRKGRRKRPRPR